MPIQIGAKPENDFTTPLGLLSDCHRRIEKFLDQLQRITEERHGGELTESHRAALETALNYFQRAAPLHTRDEEESLFPRMREIGGARAEAAFAALSALEADHDAADAAHAEVDILGRKWLAEGRLTEPEAVRLGALMASLQELYARHIAVEDAQVFLLAAEILSAEEIRRLGREMALRRGLNPDRLPMTSHYPIRKLNGHSA